MKKAIKGYHSILRLVWNGKKSLVILCVAAALTSGLFDGYLIEVEKQILNKGIECAKQNYPFFKYIILLIKYVLFSLTIKIIYFLEETYIYPSSQLFFRTRVKGELIKKLNKIEYISFENPEKIEIIDKAFGRAEESALHVFPNYIYTCIQALLTISIILGHFVQVRWWLALFILIPYMSETYYIYKRNFNIYTEMDSYWKEEQGYGLLPPLLIARDAHNENFIFNSFEYIIGKYRKRLNYRNKQFEKFYYLNLQKVVSGKLISRITQIAVIVIFVMLYNQGTISIGALISYSMSVLTVLWDRLDRVSEIIKWSGYQINTYDYYHRYLDLEEEKDGSIDKIPDRLEIEFEKVCFKYPNQMNEIIHNLSFKVCEGERIGIVGLNGTGKTTIIKLMVGLYKPTKGRVLLSGHDIRDYSRRVRKSVFGVVFQDFNKYALSLGENILLGAETKENKESLFNSIDSVGLGECVKNLPQKEETLLTSKFEGGIDLSGGQWQRIGIARALINNPYIIVLDEPTSNLDPKAEDELYRYYLNISRGKLGVFVTHRLAATEMMDKVIVISGGEIIQVGTHNELLETDGLYKEMFLAQMQKRDKNAR